MKPSLLLLPCLLVLSAANLVRGADAPLDIGSRRELFVDDFLIDKLTGKAEQRLHHPQPQEIVIKHDQPWEGSGSGFHSIFKDGDKYRMYYKAWQLTVTAPGTLNNREHPLFTCYAESEDGIHWRKPDLGLHEFNGSNANNIVIALEKMGDVMPCPGHPAVFKDDNPAAAPDAKYKAILRSRGPMGVLVLKSPDGLRWSLFADAPVITDGAFDSQNVAFWDAHSGQYRAYWRYFTEGTVTEKIWKPAGVRAIRTATSKDLIHWENQHDLSYSDSPEEALYTNAVKPYHRAPHVLLGFPTRYIERQWSDSLRALPDAEHREWRSKVNNRYGTAITEGLFMASRDGVTFKRWNEGFLPPGIERPGAWNYGQQFTAWHLVETKSEMEGAPNELSLYASENYWTGRSNELRRYTLRLDGFVSVQAPMSGGELVTKPLTFQGGKLNMNFATSAAGVVKVEIQDANGRPLPGFTLKDSREHFGNSLERTAVWKRGADVSSLAGTPVRLRFVLQDADLYALQFVP